MDAVTKEKEEEAIKRDEINLRREARRRKILENAKSRLERLNGRVGSGGDFANDPKVAQSYEYLDPEVEPDIPIDRVGRVQTQGPFNADFNELFSSLGGTEANPEQKRSYMLTCRAHIVLAAAIAYVLSLVGYMGLGKYGIGVSVLPALLAVALELMFFKDQQQNRPIINLFITICGFKVQEANKFLQFFSTIQSLIVDVGIFVFFFCGITFVLTCVNDVFADLVVIK